MKKMRGTIVEESLLDSRFVNQLEVLAVRISNAEKPQSRWHLYKVNMTLEQILALADQLLPGWYAHFWDDKKIYAVFAGYEFEMSRTDKSTWQSAIKLGLEQGIPLEQLEFVIDE